MNFGHFRGPVQAARVRPDAYYICGLQQPLRVVGLSLCGVDRALPGRGRLTQKHAENSDAVAVDFLPQCVGQRPERVLGRGVCSDSRSGLTSQAGVHEHHLALSAPRLGGDLLEHLALEIQQPNRRAAAHQLKSD